MWRQVKASRSRPPEAADTAHQADLKTHCVVPAGNSTVRDTHERCHMSATTTITEDHQVYATGRTRSIGWRLSQLAALQQLLDRKRTRLNSSHVPISHAVVCLKKKNVL